MARMPRPSRTSILDARAFVDYISPSRRSMARVGALTTGAEITARITEIDNDAETLGDAISAESKRRTASYAADIVSGKCSGKTNPSTGYNDCWTQNDADFYALSKSFAAWRFDWSGFKASGVTIGNSGEIDGYASRLHSLRSVFESLTGKVLTIPEASAPREQPSSLGDAVKYALLGMGGLAVFLLIREK